MNRREFLLGAAAAPLFAAARKPNIVLILADDLGYGDLACYGNDEIRTPHLDAMARGGVRFTDFHASGAVCSPTRAGLLTGRYQQRCGITEVLTAAGHRDQGLPPETETTFAKQLRHAGYATGIFGKWHLGYDPKYNPDKHGFDRFRGYVSGNVDYFSHVDQTGRADWWDNSTLTPEEGYTTDLITRHGIEFIESNERKPFCLYLPYETVHSPYQGPNDKPIRKAGAEKVPVGDTGANIPATYKAMIESMDAGIGKVMDTLRRLKLERETFVFFFSDNGATRRGSNGNLRGYKASLWEGGHREPAIAYWPGRISGGRVARDLSISLDLFPTFLELAGAPQPGRKLDGTSLLPLLAHNKPLGERTLFWGAGNQRAARKGDWKLLLRVSGGPPGPLLFNLADDPGETADLAEKEPARVKELMAALSAWEAEVSPKGASK